MGSAGPGHGAETWTTVPEPGILLVWMHLSRPAGVPDAVKRAGRAVFIPRPLQIARGRWGTR